MDTSVNRQVETGVCPTCGKQFPWDNRTCPYDGAELVKQLPDPMIGTMLPRHYRITHRLGRGAMSVVYGGVYEPLNQPVAIKLLKSHLVSDMSTFKRFQQEAKTAGALEHPNVVGILDFGVTDQGVPYLIMELLQGESLAERLKRLKMLPVESVISIFSQAADALQYTHERGIIHRDVKPSNILIVEENGVEMAKIVDFGIAKLQTSDGNSAGAELTATGEVFGTPLYVSPEQAMGRPLDWRADIYSLGCVMYESLVGQPAFNGPTAFDVIRMQITAEPAPIQGVRKDLKIPPSLAMAVTKSMAKDPNLRYQSMTELLQDLQHAQMELAGAPPRKFSKTPTVGLTVPGAAPQATLRRSLPVMPFLMACISGCLAGVLILFSLDFKAKLEQSSIVPMPHQMDLSGQDIGNRKQAPQVLEPKAAELSHSAQVKYQKGNFAGAESDCKKAIKLAEDAGQRQGVSILLTQLGSIYTAEHNYPEALASGRKALAILEKSDPPQKENLALALNLTGIVYYYMRDVTKAEPLLLRAWQIDQELYGANSIACAGDLTNLARVNELQKKLDKAESNFRDALTISERVYGRTDRRLKPRIENLAAYLARRHRETEVRSLERRAREIASGK